MQLYVGRSSLRGDLAKYARRLNLLEIKAEPGRLPRGARLRGWRKAVPEGFVFSVVLPRSAGELLADAPIDPAISAAEALEASWFLLQTPATVMPGARTLRRLEALKQRLPGDRRLAWEPRGVWEDEVADRAARDLGLYLVRDLAQRPAPPRDEVVYTRLLALGEGARVRQGAIERLAESLEGVREAFVVIEGEGAVRAAQALPELLGTEGLPQDPSTGV